MIANASESRVVRVGWREAVLAALLFTAAVVAFAYPISVHPATLRFPTGPDGDIGVYLLGWNTHAFLHRPWAIFDANIYYPQHLTLAYGENVIGLAFFAAPVIWLTGDLMLATNWVLLLSCVLCGLGAYVLARRVGCSVVAALLAGLIFELSPPRFFRIGQMNLSAVYWIPFVLASLHAYFDGGRKRDLRLAVGMFTLQILASGHGAVFMVVMVAGFLAYRLALGEPIRPLKRLRDFGVTGLLLLLPSILVFLPYRLVQREVGLRRGLGSWAFSPESWFASPTHLHQWLLHVFGADDVNRLANAFLFPGYLPYLLSAVAVAWPLWLSVRAGASRMKTRRAVAVPAATPGSGNRAAAADREVLAQVRAVAADSVATAQRVLPPTRPWRWLAIVLEVVLFFALAAAVALTITGPVKLKIGKTLLFSSRGSLRAWLWVAGIVAGRLALARLVPIDAAGRLRRAVGRLRAIAFALLRGLAALVYRFVVQRRWVRPVRAWAERRRTDSTALYAFLTLLAWGLALGPPYGLWQYVYALPGFSFIRAPSRFTLMLVMGLAILSAIGFDRVAARFSSWRRRGLGVVLGILLLAELAAMPMRAAPNNIVVPAIDRWLDTRPKPFVVAEVPTPKTNAREVFEWQQANFMIHSTAHWQKTVHGYSGWRTDEHEALYEQLVDFPDEKTLEALASFDVTYVVVHHKDYLPGEWPAVEERIRSYYPQLRFEHAEADGRVYSLHRRKTAPAR